MLFTWPILVLVLCSEHLPSGIVCLLKIKSFLLSVPVLFSQEWSLVNFSLESSLHYFHCKL